MLSSAKRSELDSPNEPLIGRISLSSARRFCVCIEVLREKAGKKADPSQAAHQIEEMILLEMERARWPTRPRPRSSFSKRPTWTGSMGRSPKTLLDRPQQVFLSTSSPGAREDFPWPTVRFPSIDVLTTGFKKMDLDHPSGEAQHGGRPR